MLMGRPITVAVYFLGCHSNAMRAMCGKCPGFAPDGRPKLSRQKSPQEKLAAAVETISLFLIVKAAPEPPNEELRVLFQDLD